MKIGVRFTAAIHTLLCIRYFQNEYRVTSDFIASSTGVHPVITRKILLQLQKAKLVKTAAGVGGSRLIKDADAVPLLDVYKAINESAANPTYSIFIRSRTKNVLSEKISIAFSNPFRKMRSSRWNSNSAK